MKFVKYTSATLAIMIGLSTGVVGAPITNVSNLLDLSSEFEQNLQQARTPAYFELLGSSAPAVQALLADPGLQLMYMDERGKPVAFITHNTNAARTISTDDVWPGGSGGFALDGAGTTLGQMGIWDGGAVRTTHGEFGGRVTQIDSPSSTSFHATHVAGTMMAGGSHANAKGMSFAATLAAYDWNSDESEMAVAGAGGINISNHSYGTVTGWRFSSPDWYWWGDPAISPTEDYNFGYYNSEARQWDQIAYNAPYYLICKSAGNDRNDFGPGTGGTHLVWNGSAWVTDTTTRDQDGGTDKYDCISTKSVAKNILTVGAINDITGGWTAPNSVLMSSFSSWGPTDDGRIKPDIVANGVSLFSTDDGSDVDYTTLSGTSMSSPNAAGSANLLFRYYEDTHSGITPLSSTVKALIIQTADEAGLTVGPDYRFGWGLMNTLSAATLISADSGGIGLIVEDSLATGEEANYSFISDGSGPVRLTLAWTDPPGTSPSPVLNNTTPMLVHDLDLLVRHGSTSTGYEPYVLDPQNPADAATTGNNSLDNVEQVHIELPEAGNYTLTISHKGALTATQYFSLISSEPLNDFVCPVTLPGDANEDGTTTSADLIYLVNYIFKSGFVPSPCEAVADANCTGSVDSADLIFLVNFFFKSGPAPCDICELIPGTWSCE
jgi:hypothetical protein